MKSKTIVVYALMSALVTVTTFAIRIPMPATDGYLNLGDAIVLFCGVVFGPLAGLIAGGIGGYAKAIYTQPYTSKLSTDENGYVLYTDGDLVSLIGYLGSDTDLILPDGITEIHQYAFMGYSRLASVTIPDSVASIGYRAFYNCSSLTSITYKGTMAQWNAITKESDWNYVTGSYNIYCTDRTISK